MKKGFSLIELVVALGIIISAILVLGVFISAAALRKTSEMNSIASRIATETIEELKSTPFAQIQASSTISHPDLSDLPSGTGFYRTSDFQGNPNIKQVDVSINWSAKDSSKSLEQASLIVNSE